MSKLNWEQFEKEALAKLKNGDQLGGKDGVMAPLIKHLLETALESELDIHLEEEKAEGRSNRRNGGSRKGLKTGFGKVDLVKLIWKRVEIEPAVLSLKLLRNAKRHLEMA
jgi:transposase-like protein